MAKESVTAFAKASGNGITIIYVFGLVITDLGAPAVRELTEEALGGAAAPKIILNLQDVAYLDSYSIGWVMKLLKQAQDKGGELTLCCPNEEVLYMFKLTELTRVVQVYPTENDAREALITGNQAARILYL